MKRLRFIIIILSLPALFLSSCQKNDSSEFVPKAVIEGYLYEGMPIKNIQISELTAFDQLNNQPKKFLSGLNVTVKIAETVYTLIESPVNAGYYGLLDSTLLLKPGQILEFNCQFNSQTMNAQTVVPSKPVSVSISDTVKYISPILDIFDLSQLKNISVEVKWSNTDNSYYYVTVKNMESNPETIDPNGYIPDISAFELPPLITDYANILFNKIKYYGKYRIILYKVNPEYADLYQTQNQDSRTLSEPSSNIENGYGIFTAFATDSLYFAVRKP